MVFGYICQQGADALPDDEFVSVARSLQIRL
jgi:hypothetical protein